MQENKSIILQSFAINRTIYDSTLIIIISYSFTLAQRPAAPLFGHLTLLNPVSLTKMTECTHAIQITLPLDSLIFFSCLFRRGVTNRPWVSEIVLVISSFVPLDELANSLADHQLNMIYV